VSTLRFSDSTVTLKVRMARQQWLEAAMTYAAHMRACDPLEVTDDWLLEAATLQDEVTAAYQRYRALADVNFDYE
jgi:hypothetical protein